LEDIELENKSLQIQIADWEKKISDLENNPPEHSDCDGLRLKLNAVKKAGVDLGTQTRTMQTDAEKLNVDIDDLKLKVDKLNKDIKTQEDIRKAGIIAGSIGAAGAVGLGIASHFIKNDIDSGKYTSENCAATIFSPLDSETEISELKAYRYTLSDVISMVDEMNRDCNKCCPGKKSECDAKANATERSVKYWYGDTSGYTADSASLCYWSMQQNTLFEAVSYANNQYGNNSENYKVCYEHIRDNYGDVAVSKTKNLIKNSAFVGELNAVAINECKKFCSENHPTFNLSNNGYINTCVNKCYGANWQDNTVVEPAELDIPVPALVPNSDTANAAVPADPVPPQPLPSQSVPPVPAAATPSTQPVPTPSAPPPPPPPPKEEPVSRGITAPQSTRASDEELAALRVQTRVNDDLSVSTSSAKICVAGKEDSCDCRFGFKKENGKYYLQNYYTHESSANSSYAVRSVGKGISGAECANLYNAGSIKCGQKFYNTPEEALAACR
jgi:hypothetical protein